MRGQKGGKWQEAIYALKERMHDPILWFPFPALIAFGLIIILRGHLLTGLNPRLGARVDVLEYAARPFQDGGIWLGVYPDLDKVVVVTSDRKKFSWPLESSSMEDMMPLINYLKERTKKEAYSTAIKLESNQTRTTAVLAVDQRLKYLHLRPVIYALAEAKIAKYGFETRMLQHGERR